MWQQIKYCEDCGEIIAVYPGCKWGRWIRARRCPQCAAAAKQFQTVQSNRRRRRERRVERSRDKAEERAHELTLERIRLETQRIALLKQEIEEMGGRTDWTERRCT